MVPEIIKHYRPHHRIIATDLLEHDWYTWRHGSTQYAVYAHPEYMEWYVKGPSATLTGEWDACILPLWWEVLG
jgi:hypothetical protein